MMPIFLIPPLHLGGWWAYEKRNASAIEAAFEKFLNAFSYHQMLLNILKKQIKAKEEENRALNRNNSVDEADDQDANEGEENDDPSICEIQICGSTYIVDFDNMVQYPLDMPYRKRKICRAKGLAAKGVAGIFTSKRSHRMNPY